MHMVSTVFDTLKTWFGYSKSLWAYARSILGHKLIGKSHLRVYIRSITKE